MPLAPSQGSLYPFVSTGLDFNNLKLSHPRGLILLVADPLSQTPVIQEEFPPLWMSGPCSLPQAFPQPKAKCLFFPRSVLYPPAFHLTRERELGLSPPHPCGQANSAKAKCILKGFVRDLSTCGFSRQLVDQKNKLCLISLISSKAMPRRSTETHFIFILHLQLYNLTWSLLPVSYSAVFPDSPLQVEYCAGC